MRTALLVIGTAEPEAVKRGYMLTDETESLLDEATTEAGLDAIIEYVSLDDHDAGKSKSKLGIRRIREERGRVLDTVNHFQPDLIICVGPVAAACVFNKGNLTEAELLRCEHEVEDIPGVPVYVTSSIDAIRWKSGAADWVRMDIVAAGLGLGKTEFGDYKIMHPGDEDYDEWPYSHLGQREGLGVAGFDLETYPGLDPWATRSRIRMATVCTEVGKGVVVRPDIAGEFPEWLTDLTADERVVKVGSNIKYDVRWWRRFGMEICNFEDTATLEHLLHEDNPKKDLKSLTFKYLPRLGDYSREHRRLVRERGGWEHVTDEEQLDYCGADGEASLAAWQAQDDEFHQLDNELESARRLYFELYKVLTDMEINGMHVDMRANADLMGLYEDKLRELREDICCDLGPINLNSPTQLARALKEAVPDINLSLNDWKRVVGTDEDDKTATKREVLERESDKHPVIAKVLEYRRYATRYNTFLVAVRDKHLCRHGAAQEATYIHPSYRTDVVETFRLSSRSPNGQNYPRKDNDDPELTVKKQFTSRWEGGSIMEADQSQAEIRAAAMLSGDVKMLEAIESGEDIHTAMASLMLGKDVPDVSEEERQSCKSRTFLILYQGGARKLGKTLGVSTRKAQRLIDEYFSTFSGLSKYVSRCKLNVKKSLKVTTMYGFERRFKQPSNWGSSDGYRIERQAFNTEVQNTAACWTYLAMICLRNAMELRGLKSLIIGQVHDSILIDTYPGEEKEMYSLVKWAMEMGASQMSYHVYGRTITVPLKCDVAMGPSWGEAKPYNGE